MGCRRDTFAPGEWYHCYTRAIDGHTTFKTNADYERFTEALYLSNNTEKAIRGNLKRLDHLDILALPRGKQIVSIGAYCIMPNHFHMLIKELSEGGITQFMQRLGTSYAMYFNLKYKRVGNLFVKPFRSKHVADDSYLQRVAEYIHLNPIELFEKKWKTGSYSNLDSVHKKLSTYPYSSLPDYLEQKRPERTLVDESCIELFSETQNHLTLGAILQDRTDYYSSLSV